MSKKYEKGRRFEYRVKEALEKKGYVVFRLAGSKPFDLIAFKKLSRNYSDPDLILFVECKTKRARLSKDQKYKLMEIAAECGARLVLASARGRRIVFKTLYS